MLSMYVYFTQGHRIKVLFLESLSHSFMDSTAFKHKHDICSHRILYLYKEILSTFEKEKK